MADRVVREVVCVEPLPMGAGGSRRAARRKPKQQRGVPRRDRLIARPTVLGRHGL